ncbi:MAG: hypothetical protein HOW97_40305, partial [Catenulispora sp.]|nr:hypothetical protein [Catenulispora sp.]
MSAYEATQAGYRDEVLGAGSGGSAWFTGRPGTAAGGAGAAGAGAAGAAPADDA